MRQDLASSSVRVPVADAAYLCIGIETKVDIAIIAYVPGIHRIPVSPRRRILLVSIISHGIK